MPLNADKKIARLARANSFRTAVRRNPVNPRAASIAAFITQEGETDVRNGSSPVADFARNEHEAFERMFGKPSRGGVWLPLTNRTLDASSGSATIATSLAINLIKSLTPLSAVIKRGARLMLDLNSAGNIALPRVATGATVSIIQDGDIAPGADPSLDQCILRPFTISATIPISRRLMIQNGLAEGIAQALSGDLQMRAFAELDRVVLAGSGSAPEPLGMVGNTDIAVYAAGTNGAAPTLATLSDMEYELGTAYSSENAPSWFINAAMRWKIRKTATAAGLAPLWNDSNQLLGYETSVTEHIPSDLTKGTGTDLSAAILGDFNQVVIGIWKPGFEVMLDPYSTAGSVKLSIFLDVGIGLMRSEAFIVCKDFVTT